MSPEYSHGSPSQRSRWERKALEPFEINGQRIIALFGWQLLFACTQKMPHFEEVYNSWQDAVLRYVRVVSRQSKPEVPLDAYILAAWMHAGLWLYSNEDRMSIMHLWLEDRFGALSSPEAFRKRCQRLELIGWGAFREDYKEAPLRYNLQNASPPSQFGTTAAWREIFAPIIRG